MMKPSLLGLLLLFFSLSSTAAACKTAPPRESQVVFVVRTDAPLPSEDPEVPALFDRLRIEVFPGGTDAPCAGCVESFAVTREEVDRGRVSFGVVVPPDSSARRVRVTLFFARGLGPRPKSSIVATVAIPSVAVGERLVGHVDLHVADVGAPRGSLDAPVPFEPGEGKSLPLWERARRRGCSSLPRDDEACIPGGAFFMGDPSLDVVATADRGGLVEHLVTLDPFFLDRSEITVAALRDAGIAEHDENGRRFDPADTLGPGTHCTYSDEAGPSDTLPVNCVSHRLAEAYCARLGKRLPTEAELAFVGSGLGSKPYVWGNDPPACDDAVFDRGGTCPGAGPLAPGSGRRDRLSVSGIDVVDLAGNVSEWAADLWNRDDDPCFRASILTNPRCETPSERDGRAWLVRGGAFAFGTVHTRAALRVRVEYDRGETRAVSDGVGFRCARGEPI